MPFALLFWGSLLTFLFVCISFIVLIVKFSSATDWNILEKIDVRFILLSFLLWFLYHSLDMLRLKTIASGFGIKYGYLYGYITSFVATFGATITPAHIGGELVIYYLLQRLGVKNRKIWATILFKTVSGVSFFLVALPVFVIYTASNEWLLRKLFILGIIFLIFSLISFPIFKWFQNWEKKNGVPKGIKRYCLTIIYFWKKKKSLFIQACIYSILLYLVFLSFAPALLKACHIEFNLLEIYLLQLPLIYAIFSSPSPGGSGVGELGSVALFEGFIPASILGIFVILWRFVSQYFSALLGGIIFSFLIYKDWKEKGKTTPKEGV